MIWPFFFCDGLDRPPPPGMDIREKIAAPGASRVACRRLFQGGPKPSIRGLGRLDETKPHK